MIFCSDMKRRSRMVVEKMCGHVSIYLQQCRQSALGESKSDGVNFPPTYDELQKLFAYLRKNNVNPAIVGGVGVLQHIGPVSDFRPTVDVDIWVDEVPPILDEWSRDRSSVGITSWISPSGGVVDFIVPGQEFSGDSKAPYAIEIDQGIEFPVGSKMSLMWLKLNSVRPKDISDLIALARSMGHVPHEGDFRQFGKMNVTQRENLDMVRRWVSIRPSGSYGE
jgi:hypothetical protein